MSDALGATVTAYALGLALALGVVAARCRPRPRPLTAAVVVLELGALLHAAVDLGQLDRVPDLAVHLGYVLTSVGLLPVSAAASRDISGRWTNAALGLGSVLLAVVTVRMRQTLWPSGG